GDDASSRMVQWDALEDCVGASSLDIGAALQSAAVHLCRTTDCGVRFEVHVLYHDGKRKGQKSISVWLTDRTVGGGDDGGGGERGTLPTPGRAGGMLEQLINRDPSNPLVPVVVMMARRQDVMFTLLQRESSRVDNLYGDMEGVIRRSHEMYEPLHK